MVEQPLQRIATQLNLADAGSREAVSRLLGRPADAAYPIGFVLSGRWNVAGQAAAVGLQVDWLGRSWTLPPADAAGSALQGRSVKAEMTLEDGVLSARSRAAAWGPLYVGRSGVPFKDATADELLAATGFCLTYVRYTGDLSSPGKAFDARPGEDLAGRTLVARFAPGDLRLFDLQGNPVDLQGPRRRRPDRSRVRKASAVRRWGEPWRVAPADKVTAFRHDYDLDERAREARQWLLNMLVKTPEKVDVEGRTLLLCALSPWETPNTQGILPFKHWSGTGSYMSGYTVRPAYAKRPVLAWYCGPYVHFWDLAGSSIIARPIDHPVGHEFQIMRPWRGPEVHQVSLKRRSVVPGKECSVTIGTREYDIRQPASEGTFFLLVESRPGATATFQIASPGGRLSPAEVLVDKASPAMVRRAGELRERLGEDVPRELCQRLVERYGEYALESLVQQAVRPGTRHPVGTAIRSLYVAFLRLWAGRPVTLPQSDEIVQSTLRWWRQVAAVSELDTVTRVLADGGDEATAGSLLIHRQERGIQVKWPELSREEAAALAGFLRDAPVRVSR